MHQSVTPSLFVGESPPRGQRVANAREAVRIIHEGGIAVLPEDSWEEARRAVEVVTGSKRDAERKVGLAKQGRLI